LKALRPLLQGMDKQKLPIERAFELAQSGKYSNVTDIKHQLAHERLAADQITGGSLLRQLREIIKAASALPGAS